VVRWRGPCPPPISLRLGWALALLSSFAINHWDLFGLRHTVLTLLGKPYEPVPFHPAPPHARAPADILGGTDHERGAPTENPRVGGSKPVPVTETLVVDSVLLRLGQLLEGDATQLEITVRIE